MYQRIFWSLVVSIAFFFQFYGCATPVAPTGGEPDRTGPVLVRTVPESGTTQFRDNTVRFEFTDYVDRNSFRNALHIEPGIQIKFSIQWRRKTAIIRFEEELPEATTIIFNIGTQLRDIRGNRLRAPIITALSTGDTIDEGTLMFHVQAFSPDRSVEDLSVLLYRLEDDINEPAPYVSQPDTAGMVEFKYLSDNTYRAILVRDINRNRVWDKQREFAQAAMLPKFEVNVDSVKRGVHTFVYAQIDTIKPQIQGVGLLTSNRLRVRFSKEIQDLPLSELNIERLDTSLTSRAVLLYRDKENRTVAYFESEIPLQPQFTYRVIGSDIIDRSGNNLNVDFEPFNGSNDPDTVLTRFVKTIPDRELRSGEPLSLIYNKRIGNQSDILDSLRVYINRSDASASMDVSVIDNIIQIIPRQPWQDSNTYEIRAWNPGSLTYSNIQPRLARTSEFGAIHLIVPDTLKKDSTFKVMIYSKNGFMLISKSFTRELLINDLSPDIYHITIFEDIDENGRWNQGNVEPFRHPAPIYIDRRFPVKSRMTSTLELDF